MRIFPFINQVIIDSSVFHSNQLEWKRLSVIRQISRYLRTLLFSQNNMNYHRNWCIIPFDNTAEQGSKYCPVKYLSVIISGRLSEAVLDVAFLQHADSLVGIRLVGTENKEESSPSDPQGTEQVKDARPAKARSGQLARYWHGYNGSQLATRVRESP